MKLQTRPREQPEINLTSLVDVVLLLLVFFMVSTSFVKETEISLRLPQASDASEAQPTADQLEIMVTATGHYLVNGRELANSRPQTLRRALEQVSQGATDAPLLIRADAQATHQSVVTAMDVAGQVGFVDISIATVRNTDED